MVFTVTMDRRRRGTIIAAAKLTMELHRSIILTAAAIAENDSDHEDEDHLKLVAIDGDSRTRPDRRQPPRLRGYFDDIVPQFNIKEFQSHFRLHPATTNELENIISPLLIRQGEEGRCTIPPRQQILPILWLLATLDSYRLVKLHTYAHTWLLMG